MAMTARTIVQKFLTGGYPAGRDELVGRAQIQGADPVVLNLIRNLRDGPFESPIDVVHALEDAHHSPRTG
jgi:Protein of unknown function (DUF2795)